MQLIADRFVIDDRGRAIDLATGQDVSLTIGSAGGSSEQAAWAERCAWLSTVAHPSIAPLIDYGAIGETRRFEAWGASASWTGSRAARDHAVACAAGFISGHARVPPERTDAVLGVRRGRAVVIPGASVGLVASAVACAADHLATGRDVLGIVRAEDRRLTPVADLLSSSASGRPAAVAVWTADAQDAHIAVRTLARSARLGGFVPVNVSSLDPIIRGLVRGRTLVCFSTQRTDEGWRTTLEALAECARPHIVCFVGAFTVRRVHTVSLTRASVEQLTASVGPQRIAARWVRPIATAARRAQGSPGRFEQLLFGELHEVRTRPGADRALMRVAEDGTAAAHAMADVRRGAGQAWPAPGEVVRLRRQAEAARVSMAAGRHQPGERLARQVMHACARRGEWRLATETALMLGRSLHRRGRAAAALEVFETARPWAAASRELSIAQAMALLHGNLLIDLGRLSDAETVLEPLLASVMSEREEHAADVELSLARCLHWQGRYVDASYRLSIAAAVEGTTTAVRLQIARSAVAIGRDQTAEAVAWAAAARDAALAGADAALKAEALEACAWAQLAAGDHTQAEALAGHGLAHARRVHDPMLVLRLRLLRAEAARRAGRRGVAMALVRRCARLGASTLPLVARARIDLLRDLLDADNPVQAGQRRADAAGLPALRLFAPTRAVRIDGPQASPDDIVALLQCCQAAQDDRAVLVSVCARLRARLSAEGVGFFAVESGQPVVVSSDGQRLDVAIAGRTLVANQLVVPCEGIERSAAGVPVRYAGQVIGVLAAAWAPGARWHAHDVSLLLSTAATAAGPALSGVVSARSADRQSRASELVGVSMAAADIRAAIERAAPAPFAVLVEGESGSGKELVARLLHKLGPRRDRPFCTLNCAALPEDLVESELFGHARGAFTGAAAERRGVFEEAHTGTLFLDEVGELSPRAQAKLLRAVQEGEIRRVGENASRRVDVRLVTATNRNLRTEAAAGRFRLDLLYRLDVIRILVPPLRERRTDIPVLAEHIWRDATSRVGSHAVLAPATLDALSRHEWPGNIRELQNVLAALVVRCPRRGVIPPSALPPTVHASETSPSLRLDQARETFDRTFIRAALVRTGGQRSRAARELGLSRQGLAKLMARLRIEDEGSAARDETAPERCT